jgi:hypothetical protein
MEGFYAFCIWTFVTCAASFAFGKYTPNMDLVRDCNSKGQVIVQSKVIQCKVIAVLVDGRRVELKEP